MFHLIFYKPIYNLLVIFLNIIPLHDIGASIIMVTVVVKLVLLPLNLRATKSQYLMKALDEEIKVLKENHKHNQQELSLKIMEVYKREKINPLSSLFVMIIQIPIFFALYFVFSKGMFNDPNSIYNFVTFPAVLHTEAFGLLDVTKRSLVIGIITGLSSFFLARRQTQSMSAKKGGDESFQDHFMKSMRIQLLYVLPVVVGLSATALPAALGLYWVTNNIITFLQDVYIKSHIKNLNRA